MSESDKMQPIVILPPGEMAKEDIEVLRKNGLCVVEAKHPHEVKFLDPIPSATQRTRVEQAAISLSRRLLNGEIGQHNWPLHYGDITSLFVQCLTLGTALDPNPTKAEREAAFFTNEKMDELRRLAREEAKAERLAAKTAATKGSK